MSRKFLIIMLTLVITANVAFAERMSVNVPMANVRSGPGTKYKVLWKLEKFHPIEILKSKGEWCYFQDYEGDKGWMYGNLLSKDASVVVKKDMCNVRSGPGTDNPILFNVERGVPFKVIERKGHWIHIRHADGDEGWIHEMLVW